jgi:hypothetical protein
LSLYIKLCGPSSGSACCTWSCSSSLSICAGQR